MSERAAGKDALAFALSLSMNACTDTGSGGADTGSGGGESVNESGHSGPPPDVTIPDVVGKRFSRARGALRDAGFSVYVTRKVSTKPEGTVISQRPTADVSARPGRTVTIVVAKPAPETSGGTSNCTPGYSPACHPHPTTTVPAGQAMVRPTRDLSV
jgi:PASTA domain